MAALHIFFILIPALCSAFQTKPHIVFIVADDLGWNDVSFHGSKQIPTPNIDILALDGIILNNYYVTPTCTPSRGSLMTGKYAIRLGVQHLVIKASVPSALPLRNKILPQYLNDLGYVSHGVGKWHLGFYRDKFTPIKRGFKSFFGYWSGMEDYFTHFALDGDYIGLDFHDNEKNAWEYNGQYGTDLFTEKAKRIIQNHNTSQPLFLYMSQQAPHSGNEYDPLQVPDRYLESFHHIKDEMRRKFAGMVASLDDSVGELVEALNDRGMLDNTLLIFTTDNGAAVRGADGTSGSNWPFRGGKYTLWEGGVKGTAWIWSSNLRKRKHVDNTLFHITDWLPTIYAAIGEDPNKLQFLNGVNQWTNIQNTKNSSTRKEILLNIDQVTKSEAIIRWPYKLITPGNVYDGLYDGWFDQEGKLVYDLQTEDQFTEQELKEYDEVYEEALRHSKVWNLLQEKYGEHISEVKSRTRNWGRNRTSQCDFISANEKTNCSRQDKPCLFNIEEDPCELNDIASFYPQVLKELEQKLQKYREESLPTEDYPSDPNSNPELHGHAWISWKDDLIRNRIIE